MRKWTRAFSPKTLNDKLHCYHGLWHPEMDRQWESDDGYSVSSRLLSCEWGNVEHVTICRRHLDGAIPTGGEEEISWKIKQEIKDELFGTKRVAIEVFPTADRMIDAADVYHLWVFEKGFRLPFGIHPKEVGLTNTINRGAYIPNDEEVAELNKIFGVEK